MPESMSFHCAIHPFAVHMRELPPFNIVKNKNSSQVELFPLTNVPILIPVGGASLLCQHYHRPLCEFFLSGRVKSIGLDAS
jgi:hypothetical protein